MKSNQIQTCCFLLLFLISTSICAALLPTTVQSPFNHLKEINAEWQYHQDALPYASQVTFDDDVDRIQYHLQHVITYLSKHGLPTNIVARQERLDLLSELAMYANQKVFPTNLYHNKRTPYFIDDYGVHCAVGYLLKVSGYGDLANQIKQEHNYDYIRDIKTPGVKEWADQHGFTLEELAWIQPGYVKGELTLITRFSGGSARGSCVDKDNNALITFGSFDTIDHSPCPPITIYQNNKITPFPESILGIINDASGSIHDLVVVGEILDSHTTVPLAHFKEGAWKYYKSPNPELPIGIKTCRFSQSELFLTISNGFSNSGTTELWKLDLSTGVFVKMLTCEGSIHTLVNYDQGFIIAGQMHDVVSFEGSIERELDHAVLLNFADGTWDVLLRPTNLMRAVTSAIVHDEIVYLGLTGYYFDNKPSDMLGTYNLRNGSYNKLLDRLDVNYDIYSSINDSIFEVKSLSLYQSRYLMVGGIFEFSDLMSLSKNQLRFDLLLGKAFPTINPIQGGTEVNGMHYLNDSLLFLTTDHRLQQNKYAVGSPIVIKTEFNLWPNPFTSTVTIKGLDDSDYTYELMDLSGRIIQSGTPTTNIIQFDNSVGSGMYTLTICTSEGKYSQKLLKE